jgi:hypothetical protein
MALDYFCVFWGSVSDFFTFSMSLFSFYMLPYGNGLLLRVLRDSF